MRILSKNNIIKLIAIILIYLLVKVLMGADIIDSYLFVNIVVIGINIILAVSLNLITGFTGQFSLGHAAFMAIGAYTSAILSIKFDVPFIVAILGAAVAAALAGMLIGIPTLRLKGDYLAIATLGFGEIIRILAQNSDYLGGATGLNDIPMSTNWTWLFVMMVITVVIISNFVRSYKGRACIAIREDEIAAESVGVNTTYYKVLAFTMGALFAGIAGALYAHYYSIIKPDTFGFMKSVDILVIVVFGGIGSITGSIVGAIGLTIISSYLQDFTEFRMIIYALILFLIMVYRPKGLIGNYNLKFFKRKVKKNGSTVS